MTRAAPIAPRLLSEDQAATYLSMPRKAVRRMTVGRVMIDGRVRWDREALDAWLDAERGVPVHFPANQPMTEADHALARFLEAQGHVAGHS